jgi:hypothetical protein
MYSGPKENIGRKKREHLPKNRELYRSSRIIHVCILRP